MLDKLYSVMQPLKVGLIINPIAGVGGPLALKGSDGLMHRSHSFETGVSRPEINPIHSDTPKRARERARVFLSALTYAPLLEFFVVKGPMGSAVFESFDADMVFNTRLLDFAIPDNTTAENTQELASFFLKSQVDIVVFVGGDGTARDICSAIDIRLPVLGVPSGVKMHSGVFAITPLAAAKVLDDVALGKVVSVSEQEVRDIDEPAFRNGIVKSRYFGCMLVPQERHYIQGVKFGGVESDELALADIAAEISLRIEDADTNNILMIFAPGSTTQCVQHELGFSGTLLGVDVIKCSASASKILALDVTSDLLQTHVNEHRGKVVIVLTAIGGQGHIIGRGNQQITPEILRKVGRGNLWIVATKAKLNALQNRPLLIDSGDQELDRQWQGLVPVITGYQDTVLYRLGLEL
ncbi:MAG: putative polyphosphate/ATP-dependent NAD kinase [Lentisphaeria bacterium]|jgi:predicted polyphosphate/ATP-dependent NAD kinase